MKLPAIPFLKKTDSAEFFLSLVFESDKISTILFREKDKTLNVLSSSEVNVDLNDLSIEQLIVAVDKVISRIEAELPEDANLEKTIFVVPHNWVVEGKISQEKLIVLKKISEELALTPMGFIVSVEAIIAYLQKKDGAPVNGIFVEVAEKILNIFIVRGSNIIDVKSGVISESVEKTVEGLLLKVTKLDVLPPKIVLLNNKEAEEISQKFLSHHWTKDLPFMHLPQVSILDKGSENEAIVNGVSAQLDVDLVGKIGKSVALEEIGSDIKESDLADEFGFAMDEDVADSSDEKNEVEMEPDEGKLKGDNFEFSHDLPNKEPTIKHHSENDTEENAELEYEEDLPPVEGKGIKRSIVDSVSGFFTPSTVFNARNKLKNFRRFVIPFVAFVVVVVLLISYYSFFLKAKVIVFTDQKAFSENAIDISLVTTGESSYKDKTLKILTAEEAVEGEQSQETTGTKDTGKEAKGTVTIFNKTESPKQLASGTTITSSNDLDFTLDSGVNIASTSSFSTSFSNEKSNVTASDFGKEYNLPSQTNFTVEGISSSDIFARNDSAFSGGSKEEIRVVSSKDLETLEATLVERLFEKAKSQAEVDLSKDDALIPVFIDYEFDEKTYDRKAGDQANSVKLNGTVIYTLGSYNKGELLNFVSSSEDFDVPDDFRLSDSDSTITISDISQDDDELSAKLSFKAVFKPQLDEEKIPELVAGKGVEDATQRLKEVQGVSDVSIEYENAIPFLPKIIPLNKNNITLEFRAND